MGRGNTELVEVFRGRALTASAINSFSTEFPLGEGWVRMVLRLNLAVVIGTGTGAIAEGELNIVKGVRFKTDRGEVPFNNCPGRGLYRLDQLKSGTPAVKDAIAAASATYRADLVLWFADPIMVRPEDTILDTARYRSVQLDFQLGALSDLFTSVGTATLTATLDCYIERVKGLLPDEAKPIAIGETSIVPPVNPSNQVYIDFERASDLAYKRMHIMTANSATAGVSHSGTPASNVILDMTLETNRDIPFNTILFDVLNRRNKQDYSLEAVQTGYSTIDLVKDGSTPSAIYSGDISRLKLKWNNDTLSTSQVSCLYEGLRDLAA